MKSPHTISTYECISEAEDQVVERLLSITRYNDEGKVISREQFDDEGNPIKKEKYQFQGELLIESIEEDLIEKRTSKTSCAYQDNLLVNQKEYFNGDLSVEMEYTYDTEGRIKEYLILNNDGTVNSRYLYDYIDQKTIEKFFDEEDTLVRQTETIENDEGQIIEKSITEIYKDRKEKISQRIEYTSSEGESTKTYYNDGVEAYEIIECVDDKGRLFETISYDAAKDEETTITREFNDQDLIIKEEVSKDEEIISVTNLEFDEFGNRVKLIKFMKLAEDHFDTSTYKFVNEYIQGE